MEIKNYKKLDTANNPHGIQANLIYDTTNALIMHLLLKSGEKLKEHVTPVDVAFYVLEGTPTIRVGDEKYIAEPDDLIDSPKDIKHCIYNDSGNDARVLVMKLPKPTTKTKFTEE